MSIVLFWGCKNHKLILSKNIATKKMYYQYLDVAIREWNNRIFRDGAEIRKRDLNIVLCEIDNLIEWIKKNVTGYALKYFLPRLEDISNVLP